MLSPSMARSYAVAIYALLLTACWPTFAHEGEDHGPAPVAPIQTSTSSPARMEAVSPDVELVVTLESGLLHLYLDRFATGEPINQAQVELAEGGKTIAMQPAGAGLYTAPAAWLAAPGKHDLTVSVQSAEVNDLLAGSLEISPTQTAAPTAGASLMERIRSAPAWASAGLGLLLLLIGLGIWQRRRNPRQGITL